MKSQDATLIIEQASLEIKLLCEQALDYVSFFFIKKEVEAIINTAYDNINELGFKELAEHTKVSLMNEYLVVKALIINQMKDSPIGNISGLITSKNADKKVNAISINTDGKKETFRVDAETLREYITKGETGYSQMIIDDYRSKMASTITEIGNTRPTFKDKLGRNLSIRNLSEMTVRYEEHLNDYARLLNKGAKFVIASQHANCSFRCEPFQGKIFLLDIDPSEEIKQKVIKGYQPTPIGKHDGHNYYSLKDAMMHGFLGYNCRHRVVEYMNGMQMPKPIPANQIKKERKIETNMRVMERQIRHSKEMQVLDKANRSKWIKQSKDIQELYDIYAKKNNMAREYWRTAVTKNERTFKSLI